MKKYGLIGESLSHSFSKSYFENKFNKENILDADYQLFELIKSEVESFLKKKDLKGLNVTIPYKEFVLPLLDQISPKAKEIGAVNTICYEDGKLIGYNTDYIGFRESLVTFVNGEKINSALILGSGGASKAIQVVLKDLEINYLIVSRNGELNYSNLTNRHLNENRLIINCTPLGTYPNVDQAPLINYSKLSRNHFLFDLVYNPIETQFMKNGKMIGANVKNGLEMLQIQAEEAWKLWNK